jgi:hypothetical protein
VRRGDVKYVSAQLCPRPDSGANIDNRPPPKVRELESPATATFGLLSL